MDKKQNNKNIPSPRQIGALALLGLALCYTGASTDDARDAAEDEPNRDKVGGTTRTYRRTGCDIDHGRRRYVVFDWHRCIVKKAPKTEIIREKQNVTS